MSPNNFLALSSSALNPKQICVAGKGAHPTHRAWHTLLPAIWSLQLSLPLDASCIQWFEVTCLSPLLESQPLVLPVRAEGRESLAVGALIWRLPQYICQQVSGDSPCHGEAAFVGRDQAKSWQSGVGEMCCVVEGQWAKRRERKVITLITGLLAEGGASPAWL